MALRNEQYWGSFLWPSGEWPWWAGGDRSPAVLAGRPGNHIDTIRMRIGNDEEQKLTAHGPDRRSRSRLIENANPYWCGSGEIWRYEAGCRL